MSIVRAIRAWMESQNGEPVQGDSMKKEDEVKECILRWMRITGPLWAVPCEDLDFVRLLRPVLRRGDF